MTNQIAAASRARRALRRATRPRWLQLSLAAALLVAAAGVVPAWAGDTPAEKQMDFGADMARRGLWKEALFRFQQAARLDPDNPRILNNVAVSFEALGLFDEALEAYQKALRAGPKEDDLRANYSRFAEFYQSFRPQGAKEEEPAAEVAATAEPGAPPTDEPDPDGGSATPVEEDGR